MKRQLLISPLAKQGLIRGGLFFRVPSRGMLKVAALTPLGWQATIVGEKVESLDPNQKADFVGIADLGSRWFGQASMNIAHVVDRPTKLTLDRLLEGSRRVFREVYSLPSIFRRPWGTTAWKSLIHPMNLVFRQSIRNTT